VKSDLYHRATSTANGNNKEEEQFLHRVDNFSLDVGS